MQRLTRVQQFAVRSMLVVAVMALALGFAVTWMIEKVVLESSTETATTAAQTLLAHYSADTQLSHPLDRTSLEALDLMVAEDLGAAGLSAVKIWDMDGTLLYSTDPDDPIGTSYADKEEILAAQEGEVTARVEREGREENANQFKDEGALIEVYAPISRGGDADFVGVFEVYKPYAPVAADLRDANMVIWLVILLGSVVVYVLQVSMFKQASDQLLEAEVEVGTLNRRLQGSMRDLEEHSLGTLQALTAAVDAKDSYTASHSLGVTDCAAVIGRRLRLSKDELILLERAGLLHDVGKIGVPERVLLKPVGLSDSEYEVIKEHSGMGAQIVEAIPFLQELCPAIRHHHERWDGGGYPDGLSREDIPYLARVLAVADAYDAMTSDRPYRKALSVKVARAELLKFRGIQFDPVVVDAMLEAIDMGEIHPAHGHHREGPVAISA